MSNHTEAEYSGLEIAIVGLSLKVPGADTIDGFWQNLIEGRDTIRRLTREESLEEGDDLDMIEQPGYVPACPSLEDFDLFDASFFGTSPREAEVMDPQQRHFLQCCWHALEDAGYLPATFPGVIGMFAGCKQSTYLFNLYSNPEVIQTTGELGLATGNDKDYIATRIAYKLDLGGPAVSVQTACSTSLVALHLAAQALLSGECDMALAGGVAVRVPQGGYVYNEGEVLSPDGHVRTFDERAGGTVFGNGLGAAVVKRLEDAIEDGDQIYAVMKGSAITNDGALKVGFTAPGADGQERVIRAAHQTADVHPESIAYVEAHGTGTEIGDPIEVGALTRVFREKTDAVGFSVLGSVKPNVGHLNAAAGMASLAKAVLALRHGVVPATLNFEKPNPQLELETSPFIVSAENVPLPTNGDGPLRAGVSSFGIGGTNAHVILEEAPKVTPPTLDAPSRRNLLLLSARNDDAIADAISNLGNHLRDHDDLDLDAAAYTLQVGRQRFEHRRMLVVEDRKDALAVLDGEEPQRLLGGYSPASERPVVFMFSGQGAQHAGMGAGLYRVEPVFRSAIDQCAEALESELGLDLRTQLFPSDADRDNAQEQLGQTHLTQPALFTVEYALAQLWMSCGIEPQAMIGHSIGEYVAACLAGVFSLDDALRLVATRGRLMQSLPPGAMLAVPMNEAEVLPLLDAQLSIAALNAPGRCVVSGPVDAIASLESRLADQGTRARRLQTSHAFHSPMMEPILAPFVEAVTAAAPRNPERPFISNVTGTWITADEATDPGYWARHLRGTVRFADGLATLLAEDGDPPALLEVGPGNTLAGLARRHTDTNAEHTIAASLPHAKDASGQDDAFLLGVLGQLWLAGVDVDWKGFWGSSTPCRVSLPGYPFQKRRYWIERQDMSLALGSAATAGRKKPDIAEWFYLPTWKPSVEPAAIAESPRHWLIFADQDGLGDALAEHLRTEDDPDATAVIARAVAGGEFAAVDDSTFTLDPADRDGYNALLSALAERPNPPEAIVHAWGVGANEPSTAIDRGFWSLLFLAQAIGKNLPTTELRLVAVTDGARRGPGDRAASAPAKAAAFGPSQVIGQEYTNVCSVAIDLTAGAASASQAEAVDIVLAEARGPRTNAIVAHRNGERYVRGYDELPLDRAVDERLRLRKGGTYVITGGLGGFGLTFATYLAETFGAKLVLLGRSALPARETWDALLATGDDARTAGKIESVRALEKAGAEVMVRSADVTDSASLRTVIDEATSTFGGVDGVIHAAGIAGGGVIQLKDPKAAAAVLAPKIDGTLALAEALNLAGQTPDFVMLCSSTIAVLGGVGQVDYCGANNFMDAYAEARNSDDDTYWVSVNWSGWQDVGMAVDAAAKAGMRPVAGTPATVAPAREPASEPVDHPVLQRKFTGHEGDDDATVYAAELSTESHWLVDEHRIAGQGALPGTTHLELARAACADLAGCDGVAVRQTYFMTPVMVPDDTQCSLRVVLTPADGGDGYRFRIVSRPAGDGTANWQEHARGLTAPVALESAEAVDVAAIVDRCNTKTVDYDDQQLTEDTGNLVTWGPRWQSLKRLHLGNSEAIAELELPAEFASDVEDYVLHPALLDVATAITSGLGDGGEYLPLSYREVRPLRSLTQRIYSHLRRSEGSTEGGETVSTDLTLLDDQGHVLVRIERFTMKRVGGAAARLEKTPASPPKAAKPATASRFNITGMNPSEGVEVLRRVLSRGRHPQIIASPTDLAARLEVAATINRDDLTGAATGGAEKRGSQHPRPNLPTPFVAPSTPTEERLAAVWQQVLGLDEVGIHDNFFELGGDSVMGIQVIAGAAEAGLDLSPEQLFEHQTVAELAAVDGNRDGIEAEVGEPASTVSEASDTDEPVLSEDELDEVLAQLDA